MSTDLEFDLGDLGQFALAVGGTDEQHFEANGLYCVRCGGLRRMLVSQRLWGGPRAGGKALFEEQRSGTPGLFTLRCLQCKLGHDALVHLGPDGPEIAIFSSERGGFSTPNTPPNVKYYLDQAHRSESVGATSAAVAMYRSAVEMLLFEQGYENGMLNRKIEALQAHDKAPAWRDQIDPEYLGVLKELGNAAVHPNDGNIEKQKALDRALLLQVRMVFEELLDLVYERPAKDKARKEKLSKVVQSFSEPPQT